MRLSLHGPRPNPRCTGPVWDTFSNGAVTLRSHRTGLVAESYRTGERIVVVRGVP